LKHVLPGLRYARLWIALGMVLLLVIAAGCLLPGRDVPEFGILSDKLKHFLAFGLLAFWFGSIVVRADLPWVGVAVVAIGGLIELLQGAMGLGRDAEWLDLVADALGVALGLILVLTPLGRWARWFEARVMKAAQ
jgi:VanZ family protein